MKHKSCFHQKHTATGHSALKNGHCIFGGLVVRDVSSKDLVNDQKFGF
jgi:hypothetical protein